MRSRLLQHLRSNAVAYLALFVALGGTSAYAANTVFSSDIVDGQVMNVDLADNAVTTKKIADGQVKWADIGPDQITSSKVQDGMLLGKDLSSNTLTGAQIAESTLGTVPAASQASNAGALGGVGPSGYVRGNAKAFDIDTTADIGGSTTVLDIPGVVQVYAFCSPTQYGFITGPNEGFTVWADNGGADPTASYVGPSTSAGSSYWSQNTTADFMTLHLEGTIHRITIWVFTQQRHSALLRTDWCAYTGQALMTPGP